MSKSILMRGFRNSHAAKGAALAALFQGLSLLFEMNGPPALAHMLGLSN